jgi:integrase
MWPRWRNWCIDQKRDCLDFGSAAVANCLTSEIIEAGLGVAMARKFLSMCSVTHKLLHHGRADYLPLDKDPTITMILEGVKRTIAPKPKADSWFSLTDVFAHLKTMSDDDEKCPLDVLRDKCITLMMIDGMARPSDIETIDREDVKTTATRLSFNYYYTKEAKTIGLQPMYIDAYPSEPRICTVRCIQTYMRRTMLHIVATRERVVNKATVRRSPLFIWMSRRKKREDMWHGLSTDRISNIAATAMEAADVKDFHASNIRGAASSKCKNLGLANDVIIARARWATKDTFLAHYYRGCTYTNRDPAHANWSIERLVRFAATRA